MKFLRSWLEDYIDLTGVSDAHIAQVITDNSSEVEEVVQIEDYFDKKVVVGKICNVQTHPNADRLKVFDVILSLDGSKKVQIVSAAQNVSEGMYVPVALEGAVLADMTILGRMMRGVASQGMCCGQSELLLETEHSAGLWELEAGDADLGRSICEFVRADFPVQTVFEIKILPDKYAHLATYLGMAIELAQCLRNLSLLTPFARQIFDHGVPAALPMAEQSRLDVRFEDTTEYTTQFHLYELQLTAPFHLDKTIKMRMLLTGIHILGSVGDLSNYLQYDVGQPSHYFAADKVLARAGGAATRWKVEQLDSPTEFVGLGQLKKTMLPAGTTVMTDHTDIVTLIGISGGDSTKVEQHDRLIIEIPHFASVPLSRNAFLAKYRTDGAKLWSGGAPASRILIYLSRLRFVLDLHNQSDAALLSISQFSRAPLVSDALMIPVDWEYIAQRLDGRSPAAWHSAVEAILGVLGRYDPDTRLLHLTNISYSAVKDRESLLTAIFNLLPIDELQPEEIVAKIRVMSPSVFEKKQLLCAVIRRFGFDQVILRPFVPHSGEHNAVSGHALTVLKPQNTELNQLRTDLVDTLGYALAANVLSGIKKPRIFESNTVSFSVAGELCHSPRITALYIDADPYVATSLVHECVAWLDSADTITLGLSTMGDYGMTTRYQTAVATFEVIQVKNEVKKRWGIPLSQPVWAVECQLSTAENLPWRSPVTYRDESEFPALTRVFSLAIPDTLHYQQVAESMASYPGGIEVYPEPLERLVIGQDTVLNIMCSFRHPTRTLQNDDIAAFQTFVLTTLSEQTDSLITLR
jgi:phenylalanyl-tRNA synthetase beta subunit